MIQSHQINRGVLLPSQSLVLMSQRHTSICTHAQLHTCQILDAAQLTQLSHACIAATVTSRVVDVWQPESP